MLLDHLNPDLLHSKIDCCFIWDKLTFNQPRYNEDFGRFSTNRYIGVPFIRNPPYKTPDITNLFSQSLDISLNQGSTELVRLA